jgi:AraC-like DNA-binding protein
MSTRSLQRQLWQAGVSFRDEQAAARFRCAEEMLRTDDKVSAIAAQLGLSAQGLTQLTRARTGLTPAELRRRLRSA